VKPVGPCYRSRSRRITPFSSLDLIGGQGLAGSSGSWPGLVTATQGGPDGSGDHPCDRRRSQGGVIRPRRAESGCQERDTAGETEIGSLALLIVSGGIPAEWLV
jgi:hypothetical protein